MNHAVLQARIPRWVGCGSVVLLLGACSGERVPPRSVSAPEDRTTVTVSPPSTVSQANVDPKNDATDVKVSEELRRECQLPDAPTEVPKFDYDEAALRPRGRDILQDVARCLAEGPMQGRAVTIIGRTDPRGTEEYNQELSMNRAQAARDYLVAQGVPDAQIQLVARGEGGAQGTNEESWALDRRVDIEVARSEPTRSEPVSTRTDNDRTQPQNPFAEARRIQAADPDREHESSESSKARVYADQAEGGEVIATQR